MFNTVPNGQQNGGWPVRRSLSPLRLPIDQTFSGEMVNNDLRNVLCYDDTARMTSSQSNLGSIAHMDSPMIGLSQSHIPLAQPVVGVVEQPTVLSSQLISNRYIPGGPLRPINCSSIVPYLQVRQKLVPEQYPVSSVDVTPLGNIPSFEMKAPGNIDPSSLVNLQVFCTDPCTQEKVVR